MKGKAIVIVLILAAGVAFVVFNVGKGDKPPRPPLVLEGYAAPDVTLRTPEGDIWSLSARRGSVILVNFWATWCDTCREEMPSLQSLYDSMRDDPRFEVVMVLYEDEPSRAAKYLEENNFTLPLYLDPGGVAAVAFGITGVPETYIVGKDGILKKKIIGPADFDNPKAADYITRLLEEGA